MRINRFPKSNEDQKTFTDEIDLSKSCSFQNNVLALNFDITVNKTGSKHSGVELQMTETDLEYFHKTYINCLKLKIRTRKDENAKLRQQIEEQNQYIEELEAGILKYKYLQLDSNNLLDAIADRNTFWGESNIDKIAIPKLFEDERKYNPSKALASIRKLAKEKEEEFLSFIHDEISTVEPEIFWDTYSDFYLFLLDKEAFRKVLNHKEYIQATFSLLEMIEMCYLCFLELNSIQSRKDYE